MGKKPLTWQQILIVLLCIGVLIAGILAWGGNIPPDVRHTGKLIFFASLSLIALLAAWDIRLRFRKDLLPDVLASLVPTDRILELGGSHLIFGGHQQSGYISISCMVQNLHDAENSMRLNFQPHEMGQLLQYGIPPLEMTLPPGAVVEAKLIVPLRPGLAGNLKLLFSGSVSRRGTKVRFARRIAVTTKVPTAVTVVAALGGAVVWGGGTFLAIPVSPIEELESVQPTESVSQWVTRTVWEKHFEATLQNT